MSTKTTPPPNLVPDRFEGLVDALVHGGDVNAVCTEIGCAVASDGASLTEALDALRRTFELSTGREPTFEACRALTTAWSEASLQYLHALSCEDPLSGLASLAHVRSRLSEIYREADRRGTNVASSHALVVVEVGAPVVGGGSPLPGSQFDRVLRMAGVAECMRAVYSGGETLGRLGLDRAVALVARDHGLGSSVAVLRRLLDEWRSESSPPPCRLWIEPLPVDNDAAGRLLDELAR